jgi:uncharacterized protein (DUF1330 family)
MPAYFIANIRVKDPEGYEEYKKLSGPSMEPYGGRFLVRGGDRSTLEGDWEAGRVVILEFPDSVRARAWWNSPEYLRARAIRERTAVSDIVLVEGA